MTSPDALAWVAFVGSEIVWIVFLVVWFKYQNLKRQQWLRQMHEIDQAVADATRDLACYHLYRILTNEDDDQVYRDAALFLKEHTFFRAEEDDDEADTPYIARELMKLSREQRNAILKKGADAAAEMGLYSEEWFANEQIPNSEDDAEAESVEEKEEAEPDLSGNFMKDVLDGATLYDSQMNPVEPKE